MPYRHGVFVSEEPTSITVPVNSESGLQVVAGTAPVNLLNNPSDGVNKLILAYDWKEVKENLGYSDDWEKFTLCQSMDASFKRLNVAPLVFINVLDPDKSEHKESITEESVDIVNDEAVIEKEGILLSTLAVKSSDGATTYEKGTDYEADFNEDGHVVIDIIEGGQIDTDTESSLTVDYDQLDSSGVTNDDIIGGYDSANEEYTGLELVEQVFPRLGLVPGQILAPGWSQDPEVASVMDAKASLINEVFKCNCVVDVDSTTVTSYQDVSSWKNDNAYTSEFMIVNWPRVKIGDRLYWYSAIKGALIAKTDANASDVPYMSPSNKRLPITATVVGANGDKEINLDQSQGSYLNGEGICTAINMQGWRSWGNNTAAYPAVTDPKDRFINIRRMFNWWGNTFILTYFQEVDDPANYRLIENVVDSENIRANGFQARGQIAGATMEFRQDENPVDQILDGKIVFHQRIAFWPPAKEIENILEFDPTILEDALGGE